MTTSSPAPSHDPSQATRELTITRGQTVDLPGGRKLYFSGHSHKDVTPEMGPSPLMIGGTFTKPGAPPERFSVNVHLEHSKIFTVSDEDFELIDYDYNQSMRLKYVGPHR